MTAAERLDWLRLARTENVGPVTFHQLLSRYGSASAALEAIPELASKGGLKRKLSIPSKASVEDEAGRIQHMGARLLLSGDADYPRLLAHISDAPPVIAVHGHAALLGKPCVAIVGARNASLNGRRFAERLGRSLSEAGWMVVSGLAAGIDASAHQGALAKGTIGVIAGGIDVVYPPENEALHKAMTEQGCVVAEMPFGTPINARLFPRRNRIVSGLSKGVIVIEAAMQSGSLITARMAAEQGREVMAVPGSPLDPRSTGTNKLIKDGAALIEGPEDVLAILRPASAQESEPVPYKNQAIDNIKENELNTLRPQVLEALSPTPAPVDALIRLCQMPAPMVLAVLLELELAGRIVRLPGNQVALIADQQSAAI